MKTSSDSMAMRTEKKEWIDLRDEKEGVSYRSNEENRNHSKYLRVRCVCICNVRPWFPFLLTLQSPMRASHWPTKPETSWQKSLPGKARNAPEA